VRRRLAQRMTTALAPDAWVLDDTGFPKFGRYSVGVAPQDCGALGKVANCQVGVSVHAVTERASCPLDWRLFCRSPGMGMPSGAARPTSPTASGTGPSGSWPWTCWTS
jgi:hypothetical protein